LAPPVPADFADVQFPTVYIRGWAPETGN